MAIVGLLLALSLASAPQDPPVTQDPPATPETAVEGIEVIGQPLERMVDSFVQDVVAPPAGRGLARWGPGVCVGAANLQRDTAQAIIDRISEVALDLGLEIGGPGCRANILVIATDDGPAMAAALVARSPNSFRPRYAGSSRSALELERFQTTEAAVRWWHVSMPVHADTGAPAVRMPGEDARPMQQTASRLRTEVENNLLRSFVIVDLDRAVDVPLPQLADFVAMVAFAQIDPDADLTAYPTVLNAFAPSGGPAGMTDWDTAYLRALYDAELNQRNPDWQISATGQVMLGDRRAAQQADDESAAD